MHSPSSDTIDRVADALRHLPPVDGAARARVLVAVQADAARRAQRTARRRLILRAALGGALAASVAGVAILLGARPTPTPRGHSAVVGGVARSPHAITPVADIGTAPSIAIPLVVSAPSASHVSVVGDFTGWDDRRVPMTRDPASGLWVTSVTVRPGRHVYAFVADDSVWMLDPRAPVATDPDFGRPGSLLLVGRP